MLARYTVQILVLTLVCAVSALAQSPNSTINGIILDPDARSIPGAQIIVVNDLTGLKYETTSNNEGIYAVPNLPPGPYRIQVSKAGFKTLVKPDIVLNVQDAISINFTLPIGAAAVVVTVEGGAPLVNTTDASVSTVVDRQFAENLPMNGRSFQTLIYLTPGVTAVAPNTADNGQFTVNGQRAASNYWMVDGVSANIGIGVATAQAGGNGFGGSLGSFSALGGTNSLVSVDAMQEFRIQTSTYAPEFGRSPGGQISILTRSGTNRFHGTVFDYVRNDLFDANNWFANSAGLAKPRERQNDFGGTIGGPSAKEKTFFFISYEGLRLRLPETTLTTVPDLQARQNAVAAMQPYLNAYPLPNGADDVPHGMAQFNSSYSNPATLDAYSLRVDHKLTDHWSLFGRYNYSPSQFQDRGVSGNSPLSVVSKSIADTQTVTAGATWSITPMMTNDLRFNYSRMDARASYSLDDFGGAVPLTTLPFPDPFTSETGNFSFFIASLTTGGQMLAGPLSHAVQHQANVVNTVAVQKGTHHLKFGVDYRRLSPLLAPSRYRQVVTFLDVPSAETGNAFGGRIGSATNPTFLFRNLGAYAQDTWRLRPRFTLTYGLRWDVDCAPSTLNGPNIAAVTGYNLSDLSQLAVAPPGTPPFKTTFGNFAPRLGVAYQLSQNERWQRVLRAGFGVFYDLVSSEAGNLLASRFPPLGFNKILRHVPFPYASDQAAAPPIPPTATLNNLSAFNPHLELPYTLEWNVAVEQSLGLDQSVSVSYVGAEGRRLLQTSFFSSPPSNPSASGASFVDNTAASDYHALQLQFRRRLSRGLQVLTSYTWSHSIDDGSAGSSGSFSNLSAPGSSPGINRGPSDFDIRHTLSAGATYDIPAPWGDGLVSAIVGHWSTENFLLVRSAQPVDLSDVSFFAFDSGVVGNVRPDVVEGTPLYLYGSQYPGEKAFNPAAFSNPPVDAGTGNPTRQGTLSRNFLRGFGAWQWDSAVHRDFVIGKLAKLQFRAEVFNVLNHPNFGAPSNRFGAGGFGLANQTLGQFLSGGAVGGGGFSPLYQVGGPRSIQLAAKLIF